MRIGRPWIVILAAALLAGCRPGAAPEEKTEEKPPAAVSVVAANRGDVEETVLAQGVLAPAQGASARVAAPLAARVERVAVREGDFVRAGQLVATLDTRAQVAQSRSAEASLRASASQLRQAELSARAAAAEQSGGLRVARLALDAALGERDADIKTARSELELARTELAKLIAGARPQELVGAKETVRQAEATRARAEIEAKRQRFLFEKGVSARRQVEDAETALTVAESALESARQSLSLAQEGARTEERAAAQLKVEQARNALTQAQTTGDVKVAQARAALRQAEQARLQVAVKDQETQAARDARVKAAAEVAAAQVQTDYGDLRAPLSGVVTRRNLNPGDLADPSVAVVEIADVRSLDLVASLSAQDGARVRAGMPAHVELADGGAAEARVTGVGQVDPQTGLLAVRIRVPNADSRRKAGAFASARIVVRTYRRIVTVPKDAILTREGKSVVFVAEGGTAKEKEVSVGPEREGAVAILKGVAPGAKVVRLGQYELEDGAKITVEEP